MKIGVIGINHKLANLKLREHFARICQQRFTPGKHSHGDHTLLLLTTCNRTEVYFYSEDLPQTHSYLLKILRSDLEGIEENFDQKLYSYFGYECFIHLARVTAGLDSAIVAETEIQGQVKAAYEKSCAYHTLPKELHYLFQKVLKIGKKVRTELPLGRGVPNLEHAILTAAYHRFEEPENTKVLFIGASDINTKVLAFLQKRQFSDLTICNRSQEAANRIAEKYGVKQCQWSEKALWETFDILVFGTKSPDPLIYRKDLTEKRLGHQLMIDLCVPRNVDPSVGRAANVTLLNIDQINRTLKFRHEKLLGMLSAAETFVSASAKAQIELFRKKEEQRRRLLLVS